MKSSITRYIPIRVFLLLPLCINLIGMSTPLYGQGMQSSTELKNLVNELTNELEGELKTMLATPAQELIADKSTGTTDITNPPPPPDNQKTTSSESTYTSVLGGSGYGGSTSSYASDNDTSSEESSTLGLDVLLLGSLIGLCACAILFFICRKNSKYDIKLFVQIRLPEGQHYRYEKKMKIGDIISLGRSRQCDICIPYIQVSKVHARLRLSERGLSISDENSSNGVVLQSRKIKTGRFIRVTEKDHIHFGKVTLTLHVNR